MAEQLTLKPSDPETTADQKRILAILAEILTDIALESLGDGYD